MSFFPHRLPSYRLFIHDFLSRADLQLLKEARKDGKPMAVLQLQRAQTMKADGIKAEREALRTAVLTVTKESEYVTLGIMAETGERAVKTLKVISS